MRTDVVTVKVKITRNLLKINKIKKTLCIFYLSGSKK